MSDIFISYASADRERAGLMARALEARGWSVWWDRTIPPGRQFDEVIEEALDAARCVVVLWSKASTASSWVKTEAAEAMRRKALIPALIDPDVKIPLEFRRLQAADLSRWQGEVASAEFDQFCAAIAGNVAPGPPGPQPPPVPRPPPAPAPPAPTPPAPGPTPPAPPDDPRSSRKTWIWVGSGLLVLAGVGALVSGNDVDAPLPVGPSRPGANVGPPAVTGNGLDMDVVWRDYVLMYNGHVSWDGRAQTARVSANVFDGNTRQNLGSRQLDAQVRQDGPGRFVFSTRFPVPGDSMTPGAHTHDVNLIFQAQANGGWIFVRNCMTPTDCY